MKMILKKLKRINKDSFPHFLRIFSQKTKEIIDTYCAYMYAKWWSVDIASGCSFIGKIYFKRAPGGTIKIGKGSRFLSDFTANSLGVNRPCMLSALGYGSELIVGDKTGMSGTVVTAKSSIKIGSRVFCGANTTITDSDAHSIDFRDRVPEDFLPKTADWIEPVGVAPVVIEDDVFLGMNVVVLKGVTIGRGTVVGAGSIVTHNLPAFSVAAGQPAEVIYSLKERYPDIEGTVTDGK